MPTYLLTWKPPKWDWTALEDEIRRFRNKGHVGFTWSAGGTTRIAKGDRVFFLRQGSDRPGIMGAGYVTKGSYYDKHWDPRRAGKDAIYVGVRLESLLHPEQDQILDRVTLNFGPPRLWARQASGTTIPPAAAAELERRWAKHLRRLEMSPLPIAEEAPMAKAFPEGARQAVLVNRYERDRRNRQACIDLHGTKCSVCLFDFGRVYGELGRGFIHVHHVMRISSGKGKIKKPDPHTDMKPVCPNCHAMLHIGGGDRTVEQLRQIVRRKK